MQIEVKLYGEVKRHAPGDQTQFQLTLKPGATLEDALRELAIPKGRYIALINGRRAADEAPFKDGDTLVLIPPISGG